MSRLVLGPVQRGLGTGGRRIWVETDGPATVEVLGVASPTFGVAGHHYAVVELPDLAAGTDVAYDVRLDGEVVWPDPHDQRPPPRVRIPATGDGLALVVGSCREAGSSPRPGPDGALRADALITLGAELLAGRHDPVDGLVMLGDQVYADDPGPEALGELHRRRGGPPRAGRPEVTGFEEYTWLYQHAWAEPTLRWLLASVPSVMVFDDHEIIDDWNASAAWRRDIEQEPWWTERIVGGLAAYWVYQHLGNVGGEGDGPDAVLLARVRAAGEQGLGPLRGLVRDAGADPIESHSWSFACDLDGARLVMLDAREGRVLDEGGRSILAPTTWAWLAEQTTAEVDHLLIGTSVPWLLQRSVHEAERWSDRVAGGAWGGPGRRLAERLRRRIDLEHWPGFGTSFDQLASLLADTSLGRHGAPPATITVLAGDVHYGYVSEVELPGLSRVRQVVSTAFRQDLEPTMRRALDVSMWRPAGWAGRLLSWAGRAPRTELSWTITDGPWFEDHLAVVELDGRKAWVRYEAPVPDAVGGPVLRTLCRRPL